MEQKLVVLLIKVLDALQQTQIPFHSHTGFNRTDGRSRDNCVKQECGEGDANVTHLCAEGGVYLREAEGWIGRMNFP